jgi:dihydrofolate reductase
MRDLILWDMLSLDGYFEDADRQLGWFAFDNDLEQWIQETHQQTGTVLFGRRTYLGMVEYWQAAEGWIAEFMHDVPKVVVSRTLEKADWHHTTLIRGDLPAEVAKLKSQPGKDIWVFGSAQLSAALISNGLVDEIRVGINPVLLGRGTTFFQGGHDRLPLRLTDLRRFGSGLVILTYRPEGGN